MPTHEAAQPATSTRTASTPTRVTAAWMTVLLTPQLVAFAWPALAGLLTYDRAAIAGGELWRLASGHLVHWSARHYLFDAVALVVLAVAMSRARVRGLGATVSVAVLSIAGALWFLRPDLHEYRGLSGIDSALFVALGAELARRSPGRGRWVALGCLGLFAAKLAFEAASGRAIFVPGGGEVVFHAHLAGGAAGLLVVGIRWVGDRKPRS